MRSENEVITVDVDVTSPGQFFACCGLLELADRLWSEALGWFDGPQFHIASAGRLEELIECLIHAELTATNPDDKTSTGIRLGSPFGSVLLINWWKEDQTGSRDGRELKVWAGSMESYGIARAMQKALASINSKRPDLFDQGLVVPDPDSPNKKKEPFYFDHRRAANAHSRDVGFAPNDLGLTTLAHPAVELLCLIGLQRVLPVKVQKSRLYDYFTWTLPIPPELIPAVAAGMIPDPGSRGFRFENWYRTGQKKHKAFRSAIPLSQG